MESGKFYLINGNTGEKKRVNANGALPQSFINHVTGRASFEMRSSLRISKKDPTICPEFSKQVQINNEVLPDILSISGSHAHAPAMTQHEHLRVHSRPSLVFSSPAYKSPRQKALRKRNLSQQPTSDHPG